jgi:hypothetical protein
VSRLSSQPVNRAVQRCISRSRAIDQPLPKRVVVSESDPGPHIKQLRPVSTLFSGDESFGEVRERERRIDCWIGTSTAGRATNGVGG